MKQNAVRLSRPHEWSVYVIFALVFVSGAAWAWLHYLKKDASEFGVTANPLELWMQRLHGATAMLALVLLGTLLVFHIPNAWRARRNRRTGTSLALIFGFLIATGYALYYSGNEQLRTWASWSHLWIGLAAPLFIAIHVWRGKRSS
jgi:cation transport ATPase